MNKRRFALVLLAAVAIVAVVRFTAFRGPDGESEKLDVASVRVEDLADLPPADKAIAFFQERLKENPDDVISYTLLGELYIRKGRETGDIASYQFAQEAFALAAGLAPRYSSAKAGLASAHYAQHDFAAALELARQTYEANPRSTQALGTLADSHLAIGEYEQAELLYQALSEQTAAAPMLARLANLAELKGDLQEALRLMERAVQEAVGMAGSREGVAWYLFRLGDLYFNAGQYDQAARHYEAALRVFDNYYLALAGLGKVRAAQGRDDEAIELYERSVAMMPQPSALAALGDLYMETGQQEKARLQFDTVELIATLAAINRQVYNRELALFYADHDVKLDKALELAEREMEVRQDIYGYDALAWTLYKNGRTDEAAKAMREALKLGTQDARLFFHAGMIAKALDDDAAARDYLTRALKLNPQFSVLNADQARLALSEVLRAMTSRAGMGGKDKS